MNGSTAATKSSSTLLRSSSTLSSRLVPVSSLFLSDSAHSIGGPGCTLLSTTERYGCHWLQVCGDKMAVKKLAHKGSAVSLKSISNTKEVLPQDKKKAPPVPGAQLAPRWLTPRHCSAKSVMRRGSQLLRPCICCFNFLSEATRPLTEPLAQQRRAERGITASFSPAAISRVATTPTPAQEPRRLIHSWIEQMERERAVNESSTARTGHSHPRSHPRVKGYTNFLAPMLEGLNIISRAGSCP